MKEKIYSGHGMVALSTRLCLSSLVITTAGRTELLDGPILMDATDLGELLLVEALGIDITGYSTDQATDAYNESFVAFDVDDVSWMEAPIWARNYQVNLRHSEWDRHDFALFVDSVYVPGMDEFYQLLTDGSNTRKIQNALAASASLCIIAEARLVQVIENTRDRIDTIEAKRMASILAEGLSYNPQTKKFDGAPEDHGYRTDNGILFLNLLGEYASVSEILVESFEMVMIAKTAMYMQTGEKLKTGFLTCEGYLGAIKEGTELLYDEDTYREAMKAALMYDRMLAASPVENDSHVAKPEASGTIGNEAFFADINREGIPTPSVKFMEGFNDIEVSYNFLGSDQEYIPTDKAFETAEENTDDTLNQIAAILNKKHEGWGDSFKISAEGYLHDDNECAGLDAMDILFDAGNAEPEEEDDAAFELTLSDKDVEEGGGVLMAILSELSKMGVETSVKK